MAQCHNCGYEWDYGGDLQRATCPSCGRKTEVQEKMDRLRERLEGRR